MAPSHSLQILRAALLSGMAVLFAANAHGQALPSGGAVKAGSATIGAPSHGGLTITQQSQRAVLNWQNFSVGAGNSVTFQQPNANAATLNRVTGTSPSTIAGQIVANGKVYLVNPNGLEITPTGVVDAKGGFIASTLGITNSNFMAGNDQFSGNGASASVVNQGTINAQGGPVALIGGTVSNQGTINAPLGEVGLGSGEAATLDLNGDGFLQVSLPTNATDAQGHPLVSNSGTINAAGGTVEMRAATVATAIRNAVNLSGSIQATSISGHDGAVELDGGAGGQVTVSGQINVSGNTEGGRIDVTGQSVTLQGATLTATGGERGGLVRIGGQFQGGKPQDLATAQGNNYVGRFGNTPAIASATATTIDQASTIDVSATGPSGTGGTAVVWSNQKTNMLGSIFATGKTAGDVEISSKSQIQSIALGNVHVGPGGTLLLDPMDIDISDDTGQGGFDTLQNYAFTDNPDGVTNLSTQEIVAFLQTGTALTLEANHDIMWTTGVANWTPTTPGLTGGTLTLDAGHSVILSGVFYTGNGNLVIIANDTIASGVQEQYDGDSYAVIDAGGAAFFAGAGDITMELRDGSYDQTGNTAGRIDPGTIYSVNNLNLLISPTANSGGGPAPNVLLLNPISAGGAVQLEGSLFIEAEMQGSVETISGTSVTWLDQNTNYLQGVGEFEFISNGVPTAIGEVSLGGFGAPEIHLTLGGSDTFTRVYGGADPTIANVVQPLQLDPAWLAAQGLSPSDVSPDPYNSILVPGSLTLTGPGSTANAGASQVTISAVAANLGFQSNISNSYYIMLAPATYPLTITPKELEPTVTAGSYVYGSPAVVTTLSGIINGDTVVPTANISGASGSVDLEAAGGGYEFDPHTSVVSGGFTLTGLDGPQAGNYTLDLSGAISAALNIAPKTLTYANCCNLTSTYGTPATPSLSFVGVLPGDSVSASGITATGSNGAVALAAKTPAGSYTLSATGLIGAQAGDYTVATDGSTNPILVIDPLAITFTAPSGEVNYGTAFNGAVTLNGVLSGDNVSANLSVTPGTFNGNSFTASGAASLYTPQADAGAYQTGGMLAGADAANYMINLAGSTFGKLTIDPLTLDFSVQNENATYGSTSTPTVTLDGVLPGDAVSAVVSVNLTGGGAVTLSPTTSVGSYTATVVGLSGAKAPDYVLGTGNVATLNIAPAPLTFSESSTTTTYGDQTNIPTTTVTLSGFADGADAFAIHPTLTITDSSNTVIGPASTDNTSYIGATRALLSYLADAGTYTISVTGLTTTNANDPISNYTLATSGNSLQSIIVNPRTITAQQIFGGTGYDGTYGSVLEVGSDVNLTGFIPGQGGIATVAVVNSHGNMVATNTVCCGPNVGGTLVPAGTDAGTYTVIVTGFNGQGGAKSSDYVLANNDPVTLTIGPKPLTFLGATDTSTYGTLATLGASLSGVFGTDDVSASGFALTDSFNNSVTLTDRLSVGAYSFTVTALTGAKASDYTIATGGNTPGSLTVDPKAVTWSVSSTSSIYGSTNPIMDLGTATLQGVLSGDVVGGYVQYFLGTDTPSSYHPALTVGQFTNAGTYNMFVTALEGPDARNYTLDPTNPANQPGILTINPEPLTLTIETQSIAYGSTFTPVASLTQGQLFNADQLQTTFVYNLGGGDVGSYPVNAAAAVLSGGHASQNYALTVVPGTLTITPLEITYTGSNYSWVYGEFDDSYLSTFAPTVTFENASTGQPLSSSFIVPYTTSITALGTPITLNQLTNAGSYAITATVNSADYQVFNPQPGTVTITQRPVYVAPTTSVYGSAPVFSLTGRPNSFNDPSGPLAGDNVGVIVTGLTGTTGNTYDPTIIWSANGTLSNTATYVPPVDTYTIASAGLTGTRGFNYVLEPPSGPLLQITPKTITITGYSPVSVVYGSAVGAVDPTTFNLYDVGGVSYSGLVFAYEGRALAPAMVPLSSLQGVGTYTWAPANYSAFDLVANGALVSCAVVGCTNLNYVLAPTGNASATVNVTPKPLTYTIGNATTTYGSPISLDATLTGVLTQDLANVGAVITVTNGNALTSVDATTNGGGGIYGGSLSVINAGTYALGVSGLLGSAAANYSLQGPATTAIATLAVAPKTVTYETPDATTYFGVGALAGSLATLGEFTLNGLLPSDANNIGATIDIVAPGYKFGISDAADAPPGTYEIEVVSLTGSAAPNYALATTGNQPGTLTSIDLSILNQLTFVGTNSGSYLTSALQNQIQANQALGALTPPNTQIASNDNSLSGNIGAGPPVTGQDTADTTTGEQSGNGNGTNGLPSPSPNTQVAANGDTLPPNPDTSTSATPNENPGGVDTTVDEQVANDNGATASATQCLSVVCNTQSASATANNGIGYSQVTIDDMVEASLGTQYTESCGSGTCAQGYSSGVKAGVDGYAGGDYSNGTFTAGADGFAGAAVEASIGAGYQDANGGVDAEVGGSIDKYGVGGNISAGVDDGTLTVDVSGEVDVGVGLDFNLSFDVNVQPLVDFFGYTTQTYVTWADPGAAEERQQTGIQFLQEAQQLQNAELDLEGEVVSGEFNNDLPDLQRQVTELAAQEQQLESDAAAQQFALSVDQYGNFTIIDNNPPATTTVTVHGDSIIQDIGNEIGSGFETGWNDFAGLF